MSSASINSAFDGRDRAAVYRAIRTRRDIRRQFTGDPVDTRTLERLLEAAHHAPSVGFMQPWNFLIIRDAGVRRAVRDLASREAAFFAESLPTERRARFRTIKIEGIEESSLNICITSDPTRGGKHVLGRHALPQTDAYSTCLAVQNLWLAARAEGIGVGWVSFYRTDELREVLGIPPHVEPIAYLCVGPVSHFPDAPDLEVAGWERRRAIASSVFIDRWGAPSDLFEGGGDMIEERVMEMVADIRPVDAVAGESARVRQDQLTKPQGSLGELERVGIRLAAIAGTATPPVPKDPAVIIAAGDHGVLSQGVSPWPQEVTAMMVGGFCAGKAAVNALARVVGATVTVLDVGVASELPAHPRLRGRKIRPGTDDLSQGPAMTRQEACQAVLAGSDLADEVIAGGADLLVPGDMGIGNTTSAACLVAMFAGTTPAETTGRGTGIDDATLEVKTKVVDSALALHGDLTSDPIAALAAVGGLEHAAIVGVILAGARAGVPVILDGVNVVAAALVARALAPDSMEYLVAGHRSVEPGASIALDRLGLEPLIDLHMRLGEGTGGVLAIPIVQAAAAVLSEMATFEEAGITE